MEELLKQLLDGQRDLKLGQDRLEERFESVTGNLRDDISSLRSEVSAIKDDVASLKNEVSAIKDDVGSLKNEVSAIKVQQRENTDIIKALLHNQETANATLEALVLNTTTREHTNRLEAKVDNLNARLFNQEAEITQLKIAK